jgi:hypothetical protein
MTNVLASWWRALLHCLHPKIVLRSLLPMLSAWRWWACWAGPSGSGTVAAVRAWLEQWSLVTALLQWLDAIGATGLRTVLAPLIVVALAVPLIVLLTLLLVAWLMTPALVSLSSRRAASRTWSAAAAAPPGGRALAWSLGCTVVALLALLATLPLWLVPPLALLLPPAHLGLAGRRASSPSTPWRSTRAWASAGCCCTRCAGGCWSSAWSAG